jgi:transcriptional regulator with PAS, ATPase and Fis domain
VAQGHRHPESHPCSKRCFFRFHATFPDIPLSHNWPGNVCDLKNVIERSVRLCRHDVLDPDDLLITEAVTYADPLDALSDPYEGFSMEDFLSGARNQMILSVNH